MANASVSGLVSGLDTTTIISQLMQVEAATQTRLKSRVTTEQSTVKSLQELNTKLATLATTAEKLAKATAWNPMTVTSSSPEVAVTAGAAATPGTFSFSVGRLAAAHAVTFDATAAMTDVVTGGSTLVRLDRLDGTTLDLDTGDGTLAGLVKRLNAADTGLRASAVRLDTGGYRLTVTSATTGQASDFTLTSADGTPLLGGALSVTAGQDAEIVVGPDRLHSATNTFAGVVNGMDLSLKAGAKAGDAVTVQVSQDQASVTASVKGLVDAVNGLLGDIDKLTAYNATTKTKGALAGDAAVRSVRSALFQTVIPSDGSTLATVGIQSDRYGKLTFDEAAFTKAYAADPAAVAAAFTTGATAVSNGFAARVQSAAGQASKPVTGTITAAITGRNAGIDRLQDSIEDWDNRLELRRATLTRQFSGLESALSKLNSQSSWLTSQISSMTKQS